MSGRFNLAIERMHHTLLKTESEVASWNDCTIDVVSILDYGLNHTRWKHSHYLGVAMYPDNLCQWSCMFYCHRAPTGINIHKIRIHRQLRAPSWSAAQAHLQPICQKAQ